MNGIWGHAIGVFIVIMMTGFIGIWIWAWRPRHKPAFSRLARLPIDDEERLPVDTEQRRTANQHNQKDSST